jgi:hypothetical protein
LMDFIGKEWRCDSAAALRSVSVPIVLRFRWRTYFGNQMKSTNHALLFTLSTRTHTAGLALQKIFENRIMKIIKCRKPQWSAARYFRLTLFVCWDIGVSSAFVSCIIAFQIYWLCRRSSRWSSAAGLDARPWCYSKKNDPGTKAFIRESRDQIIRILR